jgi:hypothetical protein
MFFDKDTLQDNTPFFLQTPSLSITSSKVIPNPSIQRSSPRKNQTRNATNTLAKRQQQRGQCSIHMIGDYFLYSHLGGQTQTMNYLAQIVSGVDVIFKNNFQSVDVFTCNLSHRHARNSLFHSAKLQYTTQPLILIKI